MIPRASFPLFGRPTAGSRFHGVWLLAFAVALTVAAVEVAAEPPTLEEARTHLRAESWSDAATAYRAIVAASPESGEAWQSLGVALRQLGEHDDALRAYGEAEKLGFRPVATAVGTALIHLALDDLDAAQERLAAAVDGGLPPGFLRDDPRLEPLRLAGRLDGLLARAEAKAHPCEHDPRYGALDFWVGDWDVRAGERVVGTNTITKLQRGCIVHESWRSAGGGRGESINYLDPSTGQWRQNWVDENGGVVRYAGGPREDGIVHMVGEHIRGDGSARQARVTFTPREDGSVHHLIEHSEDGETWTEYFNAIYVRREE